MRGYSIIIRIQMFESEEKIKVCTGVYSGCIYEMETWVRRDEEYMHSDEDIVMEMEEQGYVACANYERMIGLYPTRERAEQTLEELHEYCWESDLSLDFAIIRQKVTHIQMNPADYIKEWSYKWGGVKNDETLVRNFDLEHNPFLGRPKEMIHHHVGDIVSVFHGHDVHWGIICALPPTPEDVNKKQPNIPFDYSDDCYIVITANTGYDSHEHVPSHYVANTGLFPPKKVVEMLKEGLYRLYDKDKCKK